MSAENEPVGTDNTTPTPNDPAAEPAKESPKPDGSDDAPQGKEPNADPNKDPAEGKDDTNPEGAPEAYEAFAVPDGMELDQAALDRFRSEEHTSELQSLMRISYAVFCLKKNIHK